MSTTWTLTRERIAALALEKCGYEPGVTADSAHTAIALEALDGLLKELPLYGYSWPKTVAGQAALTLTAATQQTSLPADYYGQPIITFVDASTYEIPLKLVTLPEWMAISNKSATASYPTMGFIDRSDVLWTWPIQTANVSAKISYQQIIDDTAASTAPDVGSTWHLALATGVASEIGDIFGVPASTLQRWEQKWANKRALNIMNQHYPPIDRMTVED